MLHGFRPGFLFAGLLLFSSSASYSQESIRLGALSAMVFQDLPFLVADADGAFKRRGIGFTYVRIANVREVTASLKRGDVDALTITSPVASIPQQTKITRILTEHTGYYFVSKNSIQSLNDLAGKKTAVPSCAKAGVYAYLVLKKFFERKVEFPLHCGAEAPQNFKGFHLVPGSTPAQRIALLKRGDIDVVLTIFPANLDLTTSASNGGMPLFRVLAGPRELPQVPATAITILREREKELVGKLRILNEVFEEGIALIEKHPEKAIAVIRNLRPHDADTLGTQGAEVLAREMLNTLLGDGFWSKTGKISRKTALLFVSLYHEGRVRDGAIELDGGEKVRVEDIFASVLDE